MYETAQRNVGLPSARTGLSDLGIRIPEKLIRNPGMQEGATVKTCGGSKIGDRRYSLAADTAATTTNRSCIVASFALQPSLLRNPSRAGERAKSGLRWMANKLTRGL